MRCEVRANEKALLAESLHGSLMDEDWRLRLDQRAQAARANVEANRFAADVDALLLHVRLERAGFLDGLALPPAAMGMADVPAEHSRFRANVAGATCHA